MSSKRRLVHILFVVLLSAFIILIMTQKSNSNYKSKPQNEQILTEELSDKEYLKIRDKFINIVMNQDPQVALEALREEIKTNHALLRSCHALVHEIGQKSFEKYGDFAESLMYQDEICNSGYLHGVTEGYFSKSEDIFVAMETVCNQYKHGSFLSWECFHGIGHGLMYFTLNDLPNSLKMCDSYQDNFASSNCVNGVFMENFNTDKKLHPSKFLREDDLFYPCNGQEEKYKADCYLYAPTHYLSLNKNDYAGGLVWCENAEIPYRQVCVGGVGSQAIKENINNPKFVEKICMSNKADQVEPCIFGMVGFYINHYGSLEPAEDLCKLLEPVNHETCYNTIESSARLFVN